MIVDNEMYLGPRQTRDELRNRWWKAVIAGLDGSAWFSWSKRGWAWWKGKENIRREADLFPYSALIHYARRADAIRGTLEFAKEMEPVREYVLPKPWGPPAKAGLIYSWANARWRNWDRQLANKAGDYHAAMRYLHWNLDVVPSHMADKQTLRRYRLLVAGGIDHVEPELVDALRDYTARGGALIVGEGLMDRDLYDSPVAAESLLGVRKVGDITDALGRLETNSRFAELPEFPAIPGEITSRAGGVKVEPTVGACKVLWVDARGRPVVTCNAFGDGKVYYVAADLVGYRLAKLLGWIRTFEGIGPELTVRDASTGALAPNVLVSRRSYEKHHALLLMNMDEFPKHLRIRVRDLSGQWHVSDPLEGRVFRNDAGKAAWTAGEIAKEGIPYCITGENRGLLLLTREPWSKTALSPTTAADVAATFQTELARWKEGRAKTSAPFTMDPSRAGYVDLRGVANATREDVVVNAKERWQGFPSTEPLVRTFAGIPFRIIRWDHNNMKGYVALRSAATPRHPAEVRGIKVSSTASRLFFLAACGEGAKGETLGKAVIRYVGGESAEMPVAIGKTRGLEIHVRRIHSMIECRNAHAAARYQAPRSAPSFGACLS